MACRYFYDGSGALIAFMPDSAAADREAMQAVDGPRRARSSEGDARVNKGAAQVG